MDKQNQFELMDKIEGEVKWNKNGNVSFPSGEKWERCHLQVERKIEAK